jgi:epoxyqueuosine reductase QueG
LKKKRRLENWLKKNQNGQMSFMESHFDKRLNRCWSKMLKV